MLCETVNKIIESLYEDKVEGKISEERYLKMSDTYETDQAGLKERVKPLKSEIAKAKEDDDKILDFMMLIYKYNGFEKLMPEILRAFIEKVVVHERTKVDGHYRQTVEIFYNFVGAIDRYGETNLPTKTIETNKQQEKRRGITPRLTLNHAPLPEIPYGNCGKERGVCSRR